MIFKGFYNDADRYQPGDTPDLRILAVLSDFSAEEDAETGADFASLDEYDGSGYTRYDAANVAITYEDGESPAQLQITCDSDPEAFGTAVDAASGPIHGLLVVRWVTDTSDMVPWCFKTASGFVNGTGAGLGLVVPTGGFLFASGS